MLGEVEVGGEERLVLEKVGIGEVSVGEVEVGGGKRLVLGEVEEGRG